MHRVRIVVVSALFAILISPAALRSQNTCPPDPNGYVVCNSYCHWTNECYQADEQTDYCYVYYQPPGCYHDGEDEPCCDIFNPGGL